MDQSLQLQLALAQAYARGKKRRELLARVAHAAQRRKIRGSTPEQIARQMARGKEK